MDGGVAITLADLALLEPLCAVLILDRCAVHSSDHYAVR